MIFTRLLHALITIEALLVGSHFRDIVSLLDENLQDMPSFKITLIVCAVYIQSLIPFDDEKDRSRRIFFLQSGEHKVSR